MAVSITGFLLGRLLAEREGVSDPATLNRLAVVGALLPSPLVGAVVARELARREVAAAPAPGAPTSPAPAPTAPYVAVPAVAHIQDAGELESRGLKVERIDEASPAPPGQVIRQDPRPGVLVLPGTTVALIVSKGPKRNTVEAGAAVQQMG